jgi:uncharacterized membrane protein YqjE
MSLEAGQVGPATNLLHSIARLGGSLVATLQTRVELLTTEISEDIERGVRILMWAFVAALCAVLAALVAGIAVIVHFWDTHRMAATVGVAIVFAVAALAAAVLARSGIVAKPRLLDATRSELQRDVATFRGRS